MFHWTEIYKNCQFSKLLMSICTIALVSSYRNIEFLFSVSLTRAHIAEAFISKLFLLMRERKAS